MANNYDNTFQVAGNQYGVDPLWLKAQAMTESSLNPDAVNSDTGAAGIAQIIPATAKSLGVDPKDPNSAIGGQARLMAENLKRYGNIQDATRAYHGGTNQDNWGPKTQAYVAKVAHTYSQLKGSTMDPIDDLKAAYSNTQTTPQATSTPDANDPVQDLKAAFQASPSQTSDTKFGQSEVPHITVHPSPKPSSGLGDVAMDLIAPVVKAGATYDPQALLGGVETGIADIPRSMATVGLKASDAVTGRADAPSLQAENQLRNAQFGEQYGKNPWAQAGRVGGEILGSAPIMAAGGEALGAAGTMGEGSGILPTAARFVTGDTTGAVAGTASKLTAGAGQGAATTALTNAGSDDSLGDQAKRNMLIGGGLRTLVPAISGTGVWAINKLKSLAQGPSTQADNLLLQNIVRDGYTPETAAAKLKEMGPDSTIGDLGENTRGLMRTVAGTPSEGKKAVTNFVENRQVGDDSVGDFGQSGRLLQAANKGLGVTTADPEAAIEQLQQSRAQAAAPLYKEAFSSNKSVQSPVIDKILETDFGKSALQGARDRMNTKMARMAVPDPELTEQAADAGLKIKGGVASGLKLQTHDLIKQDMDDQINAAIKKVGQGSMRAGELKDMQDLRNAYVKELDANDVTAKAGPNSVKPEGGSYARARAAYAGPSKSMEAVQLGQDFVKNPSAVNAAQLSKMTDGDRAFARQGVAGALQDTLMNTPDGADSVKKIMGSPTKRKQLATFFDSAEDFTQFRKAVEAESEKFKTYKAVTGGSPTTPRLNEQADAGMGADEILDLAGHTIAGNHVGVAAKVFNKLLNKQPSFGAEQANTLAPRMLPGSQQAEALGRLGKLNFDQTRRLQRSKAIDSFAGAYGAPAAIIGVNRLRDITGAK